MYMEALQLYIVHLAQKYWVGFQHEKRLEIVNDIDDSNLALMLVCSAYKSSIDCYDLVLNRV